jgi:hypothetical protein
LCPLERGPVGDCVRKRAECLCQKGKNSSIKKAEKKQLKIKYLHEVFFDYFAKTTAALKK